MYLNTKASRQFTTKLVTTELREQASLTQQFIHVYRQEHKEATWNKAKTKTRNFNNACHLGREKAKSEKQVRK